MIISVLTHLQLFVVLIVIPTYCSATLSQAFLYQNDYNLIGGVWKRPNHKGIY
jgi:hypothetical protein